MYDVYTHHNRVSHMLIYLYITGNISLLLELLDIANHIGINEKTNECPLTMSSAINEKMWYKSDTVENPERANVILQIDIVWPVYEKQGINLTMIK